MLPEAKGIGHRRSFAYGLMAKLCPKEIGTESTNPQKDRRPEPPKQPEPTAVTRERVAEVMEA